MREKNARQKVRAARPLKDTRQYRLIKGVATLLMATGPTKQDILKLVTMALADLDERNTADTPWLADEDDLVCSIANVIQAWHRQSRLLDDKAKPRPLPLKGDKQSVETLVKEFCPGLNSAVIIEEMLKARLIKPSAKGTYVPNKLHVYYYGAHPLLLMNACRNAIRFMDTVNYNMRNRKKDSLYVERVAHVTDLPKDKLRAFLDLASQQSNLLLNTTNDWLESNRVALRGAGRKKSKSVEAGIHVFAFSSSKKT